jgi:3-dehydroshikimate dehydratase
MRSSFCSIAYRKLPAIAMPAILHDVRAAGYDGVEVWWPHVEGLAPAQLAELRAAADAAGLAMPMLSPYLGTFDLGMTNRADMLARTRAAAPVATALGIPLLRAFVGWTCACSSLTASDEYWRYVIDGFREMAAIAADHGLTIAMETHEQTLVDSVAGVHRMIAEADPRLRLNFQIDDLAANSGLPDGLAVYMALRPWIVHMHVQLDAPGSPRAAETRRILDAMHADGFTGFTSIENCSGAGAPAAALNAGRAILAR